MQFKQQGKNKVWISACSKYHIEQRGGTQPYFVASRYIVQGAQYSGRIGSKLADNLESLQAAIFFCEEDSAPITTVEVVVTVLVKHRGGEPMDKDWAECLATDRLIAAVEAYNTSNPDPAYSVHYGNARIQGE